MVTALLRTLRPHQWVKNLFVLAPFVFAGQLLQWPVACRAGLAFVLFCLASSAVYVLNDLTDVAADRAHPVKRHRPIAAGLVSERAARAVLLSLAAMALGLGFGLSPAFAATLLAYLLLNIAYSARLKRIAYLDVLCIAIGFELRVIGGSLAAQVPASAYLLTVTLLLALFLGFGKRMHELMQAAGSHTQRAVLRAYDRRTLLVLLSLTALATFSVYVIYALDPATRQQLGSDYLVFSSAFTLFGLWRFLYLVRAQSHIDSPTEEMLRDRPFLANLLLWMLSIVALMYLDR